MLFLVAWPLSSCIFSIKAIRCCVHSGYILIKAVYFSFQIPSPLMRLTKFSFLFWSPLSAIYLILIFTIGLNLKIGKIIQPNLDGIWLFVNSQVFLFHIHEFFSGFLIFQLESIFKLDIDILWQDQDFFKNNFQYSRECVLEDSIKDP